MGEEYVYYFLFNDVDIEDYPKEYPPTLIRDSKNNINVFLSFDDIDKDKVYIINKENLTDDFKIFSHYMIFNTWYVYYN